MNSNSETIKKEINDFFTDKGISEINFWIKYHKIISFLYKESTVFFFIFPFFMINFFYRLFKYGPTQETMCWGLFFSIVYLAFYHLAIKKIPQFRNLKETKDNSLLTIKLLQEYRLEKFRQ